MFFKRNLMLIATFLFVGFLSTLWLNSKKIKNENVKEGKSMFFKLKENLKPQNLIGISPNQIEQHWKLYEGYVTQSNKLQEELNKMLAAGESSSLIYSDRRRRLGFELNGIVLHELYFENLTAGIAQPKSGKFIETITKQFGSFDKWKEDFINCGKTRGIGWAILYFDPSSKTMVNSFIAEHEIGHIATFKPILVMDVWEHAYMVDYSATDRGKYIDAFMQNINWEIVEKRFNLAI